jgi:hypothetical protein
LNLRLRRRLRHPKRAKGQHGPRQEFHDVFPSQSWRFARLAPEGWTGCIAKIKEKFACRDTVLALADFAA